MSSFSQHERPPKTKEEAILRLEGYKMTLAQYKSIPDVLPESDRMNFFSEVVKLEERINSALYKLQSDTKFWLGKNKKLQAIGAFSQEMTNTDNKFKALSKQSQDEYLRIRAQLNRLQAAAARPAESAYTATPTAPNLNPFVVAGASAAMPAALNPFAPVAHGYGPAPVPAARTRLMVPGPHFAGRAASATVAGNPNIPMPQHYGSIPITTAGTSTLTLPGFDSAVAVGSSTTNFDPAVNIPRGSPYANPSNQVQNQRWDMAARSTPNLNYRRSTEGNGGQPAGPSRMAPPPVPQLSSNEGNSRQWHNYYPNRQSFNYDGGEYSKSVASYGSSDNSTSGLVKRTS